MQKAVTVDAPAKDYKPLTPSDDAADNVEEFRGIYVGTAGDVVLVSASGNKATFKAASGTLDVGGVRVDDTGTTANDIIALY